MTKKHLKWPKSWRYTTKKVKCDGRTVGRTDGCMDERMDRRMDRRTDGRMDQRADTLSYRDARTHLKKKIHPHRAFFWSWVGFLSSVRKLVTNWHENGDELAWKWRQTCSKMETSLRIVGNRLEQLRSGSCKAEVGLSGKWQRINAKMATDLHESGDALAQDG